MPIKEIGIIKELAQIRNAVTKPVLKTPAQGREALLEFLGEKRGLKAFEGDQWEDYKKLYVKLPGFKSILEYLELPA